MADEYLKTDSRMDAKAAGYMELSGAIKNADCHKVRVDGGVSTELGCCNEFDPDSVKVKSFKCGNCEHVNHKYDDAQPMRGAFGKPKRECLIRKSCTNGNLEL